MREKVQKKGVKNNGASSKVRAKQVNVGGEGGNPQKTQGKDNVKKPIPSRTPSQGKKKGKRGDGKACKENVV